MSKSKRTLNKQRAHLYLELAAKKNKYRIKDEVVCICPTCGTAMTSFLKECPECGGIRDENI